MVDRIWFSAPSPAMCLWPDEQRYGWRVNEAARDWSMRFGMPQPLWASVAEELYPVLTRAGSGSGTLADSGMQWRCEPVDTGWLVWLTPPPPCAGPWDTDDARLALVQEFSSVGLFERNLQTGEARWDRQVFALFGFNPQGAAPSISAVIQRVHPDDRDRFSAAQARFIREGGRHALRYRVCLEDGSTRQLQTLVEVRRDACGEPLRMTGAVIDDSSDAERARAQSTMNAHLRNALLLARVSVWRIEEGSQRIHFNDTGYELIGLAPQVEGMDLGELRALAHPDDQAVLLASADLAIETGTVVDAEVRFADPQGRYKHMLTRRVAERDDQGRITGLLGITLDQTASVAERKRAEALARRIEVVTDVAGIGMWAIDLQSGGLEWNAQMFRIYGLPPAQLPADAHAWVEMLVHEDDRPLLRALQMREKTVTETSFEVEFRIVRPDGEVRWVVSRSRRELHEGRTLMLGIHLDVTTLVQQRELAEQALHDKEVAQRDSVAKSDFLASVSHELRTPLNAVLGFAQLIEHEVDVAPRERLRERAVAIRTAGEHLLSLVDRVLKLASSEGARAPGQAASATGPGARTGAASAAPATGGQASPADRPPLRILYIEDNPVNIMLVQELVAMRPTLRLDIAETGEQGVAAARTHRPQVVLIDMQLPDIDGHEVLRRLRAAPGLERQVRIALSANGMHGDIAAARAVGFDDYWTKPIDFKQFLAGLDELERRFG